VEADYFLSDVLENTEISLTVSLPAGIGKPGNITSEDVYSAIKTGSTKKIKVFTDSKKSMSFIVDSQDLPALKKAVALALTRKSAARMGAGSSQDEPEEFLISDLYELFSESSNLSDRIQAAEKKLGDRAKYDAIMKYLDQSIQVGNIADSQKDSVDRVVSSLSKESLDPDEVKELRSTLRTLLMSSESGRVNSSERAIELSELLASLLKKYRSPREIKNALLLR
jgi:hypothetical protein